MTAPSATVGRLPRRVVQWAVLWALLLSTAEFSVLGPLHGQPGLAFLLWWLTVWSLPLWCLAGGAYLLVAHRALRRNDWRVFAVGGLAVAGACSVVQMANAMLMGEFWRGSSGEVSIIIDSTGYDWMESLLVYDLWVNLFYGGLLMAGYTLMLRSEQMQGMLREAAIARVRTEAMLGEVQLQALQAQVDPLLLLACLDEVQALYREQPDRADNLLERLVDFLRAAMPGLKQRRSTLRAELQVAETFVALLQLMPGRARWSIEAPGTLLDTGFPSLLLLPILTLARAHEAPQLVVHQAADAVTLQVLQLPRGLPEHVRHSTLGSLRAALGARFRMHVDEAPPFRLVIELDVPANPQESDHERRDP